MPDTIIDHASNHPEDRTCHFVHPENGRRCGSPALRGEPFCYHHNEERPRVSDPGQRKRRRNTFDLADPGSRTGIQDALGSIFLRIASNDIDLKRAGLLLYCLQIASSNLTAAEKEQGKERECPTHDAASSRHGWGPQTTDRAAIQDALGKLFPRIDDHELSPRQAGLLLYCLQIASSNLKISGITKRTPSAEAPEPTAEPSELDFPEGAPGFSPVNNQPITTGFSPGSRARCNLPEPQPHSPDLHPKTAVKGEAPLCPEPSALNPAKGRAVARSTFAALLEALARRQGIDVEKLNQAHEATILLRLHAVAEPGPLDCISGHDHGWSRTC